MENEGRRTFLKRSATAMSAVALTRCAPVASDADASVDAARADLPGETLRAVADVVLPAELEPGERERVVSGFEAWLDGYEPVTEQNHGYGTSEIEYGPADPGPAWAAQLEALELEARRRHDAAFASLSPEGRESLLRRQLEDVAGQRMPSPLRAPHVALGLLARYYDSPAATDRCYRVSIAKLTCRGLGGATQRPRPLGRS